MIARRHISTILVILSIIFLPYWIYVPLVIMAMAFFPVYWEAILLSFFIDALYGARVTSFYSFVSSASFLSLLGLLILLPLRERLRSHV